MQNVHLLYQSKAVHKPATCPISVMRWACMFTPHNQLFTLLAQHCAAMFVYAAGVHVPAVCVRVCALGNAHQPAHLNCWSLHAMEQGAHGAMVRPLCSCQGERKLKVKWLIEMCGFHGHHALAWCRCRGHVHMQSTCMLGSGAEIGLWSILYIPGFDHLASTSRRPQLVGCAFACANVRYSQFTMENLLMWKVQKTGKQHAESAYTEFA